MRQSQAEGAQDHTRRGGGADQHPHRYRGTHKNHVNRHAARNHRNLCTCRRRACTGEAFPRAPRPHYRQRDEPQGSGTPRGCRDRIEIKGQS